MRTSIKLLIVNYIMTDNDENMLKNCINHNPFSTGKCNTLPDDMAQYKLHIGSVETIWCLMHMNMEHGVAHAGGLLACSAMIWQIWCWLKSKAINL